MPDFSALLNVPILQALGVILLIGLAERTGIPVISMLKSVLKMNEQQKKWDDQQLADALKHVLVDEEKSPILVEKNIDRICDDIKKLRERQHDIANDMQEVKTDVAYMRGLLERSRV